MATRALIRSDDLRRWARVAREEGVTINGHLDPSGAITIHISALAATSDDGADDFEARMSAFVGKR